MNLEGAGNLSQDQPVIDVEFLRKELCQQRQSRLEQLIRLSYKAETPCPVDQAEMRAALTTGTRRALADVDAALFRMARGIFGRCELCGTTIPHTTRGNPDNPALPAMRPAPARGYAVALADARFGLAGASSTGIVELEPEEGYGGAIRIRVRCGGSGPPWCCCTAIRGRLRPGTPWRHGSWRLGSRWCVWTFVGTGDRAST